MPSQIKEKYTKMNKTKKMVFISMLAAQAIVLGYVERLIPLQLIIPIPGVKLGLANIITLIAIYILDFKGAFTVIVLRTSILAMLFGSMISYYMSITGGIFSLIIMYLCVYLFKDKISPIGISIVGAVFHNIGQLLVASIIIETTNIFVYLPALLITAVVSGTIIGIIVGKIKNVIIEII